MTMKRETGLTGNKILKYFFTQISSLPQYNFGYDPIVKTIYQDQSCFRKNEQLRFFNCN